MSTQANPDKIKIRVISEDGNEIHFLIKDTTSFGKVMKSYAERVGLPMTSFRFVFDGKKVGKEETPKMLDMEDGDAVEVYTVQTGGNLFY